MATAPPNETSKASLPALIGALFNGETHAKIKRVAVASAEARDLNAVLAKLRNTVNQAVAKHKKDGSNFRVESGAMLTDDKTAFLCTAAVTRKSGMKRPSVAAATEDDDDVDI